MVLLTSSAVSVAISGAIICAFTFLLFLSGYVLQQRTVRSLQEALRQPPETHSAIPSIAPQYLRPAKTVEQGDGKIDEIVVMVDTNNGGVNQDAIDASAVEFDGRQTLDILPASVGLPAEATTSTVITSHRTTDSLAYILNIPHPEDLCSAALFARQERQSTVLARQPSIIFLYPSTWETSPSPLHMAALTFMRDIQDEHSLIYHPVEISAVWSGVGVNSQLLSELQRNRWDYDRILYLKSPGLVQDVSAIESALQYSSIKSSWAPISASAGHDPDMLFWSRKKGLMMPRGDMKKLTISAMTSHSDHHASEMDIEVLAKSAAYVLFDEDELKYRRNEKEWFGGLFEKFERERTSICKGKGLLVADQDKVDLRRRV